MKFLNLKLALSIACVLTFSSHPSDYSPGVIAQLLQKIGVGNQDYTQSFQALFQMQQEQSPIVTQSAPISLDLTQSKTQPLNYDRIGANLTAPQKMDISQKADPHPITESNSKLIPLSISYSLSLASSQANNQLKMMPVHNELKNYVQMSPQINSLLMASFSLATGSNQVTAYKVFYDSLIALKPYIAIPGNNVELQKLIYNVCAITHDGNGFLKQSLTKNEINALALSVTKYLIEVTPRTVHQDIQRLAAQGIPGFDFAVKEFEKRYSNQLNHISCLIKDSLNWLGDVSEGQQHALIGKIIINDANLQLQQIQTMRLEGRLFEAVGFGTQRLSDGSTIFGRYPQLEIGLHQELLSKQPTISIPTTVEQSSSSTTVTQQTITETHQVTIPAQTYIKNLGYNDISFELPSTATIEQQQTHAQLVGLIEHISTAHSQSTTTAVKLLYDYLGSLAADAILYNQNPNMPALKYDDQFYDSSTRASGNISIINGFLENPSSLSTFNKLVELYTDYAMSHPVSHIKTLLTAGCDEPYLLLGAANNSAPLIEKSQLTTFEQQANVKLAELFGIAYSTANIGVLAKAGSDVAKIAAKRCAQQLPRLMSRYTSNAPRAVALVNQRALHSNELPSTSNPAIKAIHDSLKFGKNSGDYPAAVVNDINQAINKGIIKLPEQVSTTKSALNITSTIQKVIAGSKEDRIKLQENTVRNLTKELQVFVKYGQNFSIKKFTENAIHMDHIFSEKHKLAGIMKLGYDEADIISKFLTLIRKADFENKLLVGDNQIRTVINKLSTTIIVRLEENGLVPKINAYIGHSQRKLGNIIELIIDEYV